MDALTFVIKEIAYDNGAVFRDQTEAEVLEKVWLGLKKTEANPEGFTDPELEQVNEFLVTLNDEDKCLVAAGEGGEIAEFYKARGISTELQWLVEEVLNTAFENI